MYRRIIISMLHIIFVMNLLPFCRLDLSYSAKKFLSREIFKNFFSCQELFRGYLIIMP